MKNASDREPRNEPALAVSVTIDEAQLLKNLVERLAQRQIDTHYGQESMPGGLCAIDSSSIEAYVSGCMDIQGADEYIALSYTTCFTFTCIRPTGGNNSLTWVNSLS